ncbi:unannotated protein [freshwater metagenome]|uniref:Unannotated protein n=1 Tax=freshwater metagenome TaxID=449393 RepID=A0A6J6WWL3_9ZZZZ
MTRDLGKVFGVMSGIGFHSFVSAAAERLSPTSDAFVKERLIIH